MRGMFGILAVLCTVASSQADTFTYTDPTGTTQTVEAALIAEQNGALVLGLADGEYRIVPQAAVRERRPGPDPVPLTAEEVARKLGERFTPALFRSHNQEPYVMGLVLAAELPRNQEARAKNFLRRAATFMRNVDAAFGAFAKEARLPVRNPQHPLVVLIFETDDIFEKYTVEVTGGRGPSAGNVSGFYSGLTNFLAIRMGECNTFDVPLHEAIHQQVYNRNVFRRLSPVPHWFDEGIATGFESLEGKINIGPTKISPRYARLALAARELSWTQMMDSDAVFAGDVLAGEAYGHAWSLHWLIVSRYRTEYGKYVRLLAEKTPLQQESSEQRQADFQECFGKSVADMQKEFRAALEAGLKRQKVDLLPKRLPGQSLTQQNGGEVQLNATAFVDRGTLEVQGTLKNTSPIRALAYHITVETDAGTYADWYVGNLDVAKSVTLEPQSASKRIANSRGGIARGYRVRIRSVPPNTPTAEAWAAGRLPVPGE